MFDYISKDTIAAVATPKGRGGIAVIRISGGNALDVLKKVFSRKGEYVPRMMYYGHITAPDGEIIDEGMAVYFEPPKSYTAEPVCELQFHGSTLLAEKVLGIVLDAGARLADPGEFTRRAFENGRIDLSQAEAVMDVIQSEGEMAAKAAERRLSGSLRKFIEDLQGGLTHLLAKLAAAADFPDEDLDEETRVECAAEFERQLVILREILSRAGSSRRINEGIRTAIFGAPNAGKSSLLNMLLGQERAIVTDIAGTTRDTLEERISINGLVFILIDTAGIRESSDAVERIGVERARKSLEDADILINVIDASQKEIPDFDIPEKPMLVIMNKNDLVSGISEEDVRHKYPDAEIIHISALTGQGGDVLTEKLCSMALEGHTDSGAAEIGSMRHVEALREAEAAIEQGIESADFGMPIDVLSLDIQQAWDSLGKITGATCSEDIIDEVFSSFCVGK